MLPFSPGPVPTTDEELTRRLTEGLQQLLHPAQGDRLHVTCTDVTAEHVGSVALDLTGAVLEPAAAEVPAAGGTPVTVDRLTLTADPVTVQHLRARARAELVRLGCTWVTDGAGMLWLVPADRTAGASGQVQVSARVADLEQAVQTIARPLLAARGFTLTSVQLRVQADGPRTARVQVRAQVRRGILSAVVDARGTASVDEDLVLTVADLSVTSANPLVSMGLAMAGRQLQTWEGRRINLGAHLVGSLALRDVQLQASGEEVSVGARVGG